MEIIYQEYDNALEKIQSTCYEYMTDKTSVNRYTYVELISMEACLLAMKEDLLKLQKGLQIDNNNDHFSDIYQSLCKITLSNSVDSKAMFQTKNVLGKNLSLLIRNINMCFGIIKQMLLKVSP